MNQHLDDLNVSVVYFTHRVDPRSWFAYTGSADMCHCSGFATGATLEHQDTGNCIRDINI